MTKVGTKADLAAKVLRDVADFYRAIGQQNPSITEDMEHNARTCEHVADMVESDPLGRLAEGDDNGEDDDGPEAA